MSHNREEATRQQDQLMDEAMKSEIVEAVGTIGQPTIAELVSATGFAEIDVKRHCEALRKSGELSYNWVCRRFSL